MHEPAHKAHHRGFARAVAADEPVNFAPLHVHIHAADHVGLFIALIQIVGFEYVFHLIAPFPER